jgi:hypothetical protein
MLLQTKLQMLHKLMIPDHFLRDTALLDRAMAILEGKVHAAPYDSITVSVCGDQHSATTPRSATLQSSCLAVQLLQSIGIIEIDERGHPGYAEENELCRTMSALDLAPGTITTLVSIRLDSTGAHVSMGYNNSSTNQPVVQTNCQHALLIAHAPSTSPCSCPGEDGARCQQVLRPAGLAAIAAGQNFQRRQAAGQVSCCQPLAEVSCL